MDTELRNTDRAVKRGDHGADALLISKRLRAGALAIEDVTLAARLGHQAALAVVGEVESLGNLHRGWQRSMMPLRELARRRPRTLAQWLIEVSERTKSRGAGVSVALTPTRSVRDLSDLMHWMRGHGVCGTMFCQAAPVTERTYCPEHAKELLGDILWYQERLRAAVAREETASKNPLLQVLGNPGSPDRIVTDESGKTSVLDYKTVRSQPPLPRLLEPLSDSRYWLLRSTLDGLRGKARHNETLWQRNRLAELLLAQEEQESS